MQRNIHSILFIVLLFPALAAISMAQPFPRGSISADFELKDHRSGATVKLSDFAGKVVVLDFFAFWCPPCAFSSPDIEQNIQRYYEERGGNANGVPVQVISVNIEPEDPASTDAFIQQAGLDLVVDDPDAVAWNAYNQTNGIPLFVVINGVAGSPGIEQWEVLHNEASYPGAEFLRGVIDSVEASTLPSNPFTEAAEVGDGWRWMPWFGTYKTFDSPWIFHEQHGWMRPGEGNPENGLLIFDMTIGWIWTSERVYPLLYSLDRDSWMRYELGTTQPREFLELRSGNTIKFFNIKRGDDFNEFFFNGFDVTNSLIEQSEILQGGPPRDGIPAIHNPKFLSIPEVDFMEDDDILVSVTSGKETRAYPFRIMNWHELVNDHIGDDYFLVTYCPLCGTAMVFDRRINGRVRSFGVSGLLFQSNVLMYDLESDSLWSQFMLQAVTGSMINTHLTWRRSEQMTWKDWKAKYPDGKVLSTDTGFNRRYDIDPYSSYFQNGARPGFSRGTVRLDLPEKEWVWGILVNHTAKAYPLAQLPDGVPIRDIVDGVELELVLDAAARSVSVTFVETGEPLTSGVGSFWFSWQDFFPDTLVYTAP